MAKETATRLRMKLGSLEIEFEGADNFLRSEVPKLLKAANDLQVGRISLSVGSLTEDIQQVQSIRADMAGLVDKLKSAQDSSNDVGSLFQLELQQTLERMNKALEVLSNVARKMSETAQQITQNLK